MKKIAIVYDRENWKTTTKLAVDEIRKAGVSVVKRKEDAIGTVEASDYLCNHPDFSGFEYTVENSFDLVAQGFTILTMPQDMPKLKEALGIEVLKDGYKNGDIIRLLNHFKYIIARFDNFDSEGNVNSYSYVDSGFFNTQNKFSLESFRIKDEKNKDDFIEAEHANGYHFDGKDLVKIPEVTKKKPTKRIILDQYESIEILVDEFEMVHKEGKIILLPK
jgi:hypothetical protein